jgi:hypothetical protein
MDCCAITVAHLLQNIARFHLPIISLAVVCKPTVNIQSCYAAWTKRKSDPPCQLPTAHPPTHTQFHPSSPNFVTGTSGVDKKKAFWSEGKEAPSVRLTPVAVLINVELRYCTTESVMCHQIYRELTPNLCSS